ncbi:MAG TPA: T9SS type A sorting domain-containing protein, partial [Ignavibacteriaceae bacterium]|nr:T9SS type A sorting domain-containing protein [Ignavibacteriaceae bacterium]
GSYFYGNVDRSYPQPYPPDPPAGPGWSLSKGNSEDFFSEFNMASVLFYNRKYAEAKGKFRILTEKYLDSEYSSYSLNWYMLSSEQLGEIVKEAEYLKSIRQNKSANINTKFYALKWLLQLEMRNGSITNSKNLASEVEAGSLYEWEISLDLAVGLFEYKGDRISAEQVLNKLNEKFKNSSTAEAIDFIKKSWDMKDAIDKQPVEIFSNEIKGFSLDAYPNPFNPTTTIVFSLPQPGNVVIKVYDILGREVRTLVNEFKTEGQYKVEFNASSLASGIYFYRLQAGSYAQTKKIIVAK